MLRLWRRPACLSLLRRGLATETAGLAKQVLAAAEWLELVQIPGAGRGVVAARDIPQGTTVLREFPMLLTPSPLGIDQSCFHCLKPLLPVKRQEGHHHQQQQQQGTAQQQQQGQVDQQQQQRISHPALGQAQQGSEAHAGSLEASKGGQHPRMADLCHFCSPDCRASANREYWQVCVASVRGGAAKNAEGNALASDLDMVEVMRLCDFGPLIESCRQAGEKFPLMMARLACVILTTWQSGGVDVQRGGRIGGPGTGGVPGPVLRGNPVEDLDQLCFAKVLSPPPPWRDMHVVLLEGLLSHPSNSNLGSAAVWREIVPEMFGLDWYSWALSRLHINVFRVDTVPEQLALDRSAMLKAAAGLISGPSAATAGSGLAPPSGLASSEGHATGAGAYLLASMLNHSCEPNLDVTFPHNNAVVALVAARSIPRGEQLCISYVDADLAHEPRRQALKFSYGFSCKCPKCVLGS